MNWRDRLVGDTAVPGLTPPGIGIWTERDTPGTLPDTKRLLARDWVAGDAVTKWLQSQGIQSVNHRITPPSRGVYGMGIPVASVFILVGNRDMDAELEILREKRKSRLTRQ
ncbi:MAG: hypothetical protein M3Y72_12210 [Acidobacteriota bacterium]|nr:hypothetical protein [Acidobacteriota bacterium]